MRTVRYRTARLLGGLALPAGILLALSAPTRAQTITASPQTVVVAKGAAQGSTTITWDAGAGIKNLGATLWQQIDGGKETLVAAKAKGSQSILIGAGETRVFKLRNFIKSKVLASVTVTASEAGAAPDENAPNAGAPATPNAGAPATNDAPAADAGDKANLVSFNGTWETIISGTAVSLTISQTDNKVTGLFPLNNGKIEGTVTGKVLRFKWEADGAGGSGRFVMDDSNQAFSGTYNRGDNPDEVDATWNGKRAADKAPEKDTPPPISFTGVWYANFGEAPGLKLMLQQSGVQVTGQVTQDAADVGFISEGIVDGHTLRFKIMRHRPPMANGVPAPDVLLGIGELVMDEDGKSFKGTILAVATSGTLVGS